MHITCIILCCIPLAGVNKPLLLPILVAADLSKNLLLPLVSCNSLLLLGACLIILKQFGVICALDGTKLAELGPLIVADARKTKTIEISKMCSQIVPVYILWYTL